MHLCVYIYIYVTLDHKNSLKCQSFEIHRRAEYIIFPLMNGLLGFDNICPRYNYLKIWNVRVQKNLNIEKIAFKIGKIKFLAMYITNQKWCIDIFTVRNVLNISMEHDLYLIS